MPRHITPPPEPQAPAYMMQYAALMMLLLAFFISILSNVRARTPKAGLREGAGAIKNALGAQGGFGLLPYLKALQHAKAGYPAVRAPPSSASNAVALGVPNAAVPKDTVVGAGALNVKTLQRGLSLRMATPVVFAAHSAALSPAAREFVRQTGALLHSLTGSVLTVRAYCAAAGQESADQLLAAERATAVVRALGEHEGIARDRLRAVGYTSPRYLGPLTPEQTRAQQAVVFYIHRLPSRAK